MQSNIEDVLVVPFELLLAKLGLKSYRELRSLLRANRLGVVPNRQSVPIAKANQILSTLRGPDTKLSRKDLRDRASERYGSPISEMTSPAIPEEILGFGKNLFTELAERAPVAAVLGVALEGGFFTDLTSEILAIIQLTNPSQNVDVAAGS